MIVGEEIVGIPTIRYEEVLSTRETYFLPRTLIELNCRKCGKTYHTNDVYYFDTGDCYEYYGSITRHLYIFPIEDICSHHPKGVVFSMMYLAPEDQEFFKDKKISDRALCVGPEDLVVDRKK